MADDEILKQLNELLRHVFNDPALIVTSDTTSREVAGWDSVKQVMIIMAVEEKFGIELTTHETDRLANVGDLVSAVARHVR